MSASSLRSIYEDMDYYFKTFEIYKSVVNFDYIMEQWHTQWPDIIDNIDFDPSKEEILNMMTVGCGQGDVEGYIFPYLLKKHARIHVCVIEPSSEEVDLFKERAAKLQENHPGVTFEWHVKTLQEYVAEQKSVALEKFHLVFSCHSLYYIEKWGAAVNDMLSFVKSGGSLVMTICNNNSPCGMLFEKLNNMGSKMHNLLSAHVKEHLANEGKKVKSYPRILPVKIDTVFDAEAEAGNMLLDFLCHRSHMRETAPPEVFTEVMNFISDKMVVDDDGSKWIHADEEELVVKKI